MTSNAGVTVSTDFEWETESWGRSRVLHEDETLLLKEVLFEGKFTPYQRHSERAEHWQIVEGCIVGRLGVEPLRLRAPSSVMIAPGAWHWIGGNARIIQSWIGDWLDESDVEVGDLP